MTVVYQYASGLPTAEEVTNFYLYGQKDKPVDMLDTSTWNINQIPDKEVVVQINLNDFLNNVGRFVDAASFEVIRFFMGLDAVESQFELETFTYKELRDSHEKGANGGSLLQDNASLSQNDQNKNGYTKKYLFDVYGLVKKNNAANIEHLGYGIGDPDYAERVYIWGTTAFKISDDTEFIVNTDGSREIRNFSITVRDVVEDSNGNPVIDGQTNLPIPIENFDFEGGSSSNIGNPALNPVIDPSGIGHKVRFEFVGLPQKTTVISEQDFVQLYENRFIPSTDLATKNKLIEKIQNLVDDLFLKGDGSIKFVDSQGRAIIYAGENGGTINGTETNSKVDISDDFFNIKPFWGIPFPGKGLESQLSQYVNDGIVYVGGDGVDQITTTDNNSLIYGWGGNDILTVTGNENVIYGGGEEASVKDIAAPLLDSDLLIKVTGDKNHVYGGAGNDKFEVTGDSNHVYGGYGSEDDKNILIATLGEKDITVNGDDNTVVGTLGNDTIKVEGNSNHIYGGLKKEGEDAPEEIATIPGEENTITVKGKDNTIYGSSGKDIIRITSNAGEVNHIHGGEGADELYGGAGKDNFYGGDGEDKYYVGKGDKISDAGGDGLVNFNGKILGNGTRKPKDEKYIYKGSGVTYYWEGNGSDLLINGGADKDGVTIYNFTNKNYLGISLDEEKPEDPGDGAKAAVTPPPRGWDPLILDLDRDGIETAGFGEAGSVMFDLNADGIKTRVGWVRPDDGLLVMDRNGNGVIDNGRELFGDATLKKDGTLAKDGFEALADLDSNSDGIVDAKDTNFSKLRIWRDLNSNGITDTNELFTLEQLGITGFDVGRYSVGETLDNGNRIADLGKYFRTDGTTENMGVVHEMGEVFFGENGYHSEFTDPIPVAADLKGLPDYGGAGRVRNLLEAATLSPQLAAALKQFTNTQSWLGQRNQTKALLNLWVDTAVNFKDSQTLAAESGKTVLFQFGNDCPQWVNGQWVYSANAQAWLDRISALEAIWGRTFVSFEAGVNNGDVYVGENWVNGQKVTIVGFDQRQIDILLQTYQKLESGLFETLAGQVRYADFKSTLSLGQSNRIMQSLDSMVNSRLAINQTEALLDIVTFAKRHFDEFFELGVDLWEWGGKYLSNPSYAQAFNLVKQYFQTDSGSLWGTGIRLDDMLFGHLPGGMSGFRGNNGDDILVGLTENDYFHAGAGNDQLYGGVGNDQLHGGTGNDKLYGGTGDDLLSGDSGNDELYGGDGNDSLNGGFGDDYLVGGAGNDTLVGGSGNDSYFFDKGWGQDRIINPYGDKSTFNSIYFGKGISVADLEITQFASSLFIKHKGTSDQIEVSGFYFDEARLQQYATYQIVFADGSVLTQNEIIDLSFHGTNTNDYFQGLSSNDVMKGYGGDDLMYGYGGNDHLYGGLGEDRLYGGAGDDILYGEDGNDKLFGEGGNDTLTGGGGNDELSGGEGSDTYFFDRGWGEDSINNKDSGIDKKDVIRFADGISPEEIMMIRDSESLLLTLKGTSDRIWINGYFNENGQSIYRLEEIQFADGTVWDIDSVMQMMLQGTEGADEIEGFDRDDIIHAKGGDDQVSGGLGDDQLFGESGNDYLVGGKGNDRLDGGVGDDYLEGGEGSDTYYFEKGWGQDTVDSYVYGDSNGVDTILFGPDISTADIIIRKGQDGELLVKRKGSTDQITVTGYFGGYGNRQVKQIQFADGTVWDSQQISNLLYQGSDGDDVIYGSDSDDILNGGAGNDYLEGGRGSDTYTFDRGWGQDIVNDYDNTNAAAKDVIRFGVGISANDILFSKNQNNLIIKRQGTTDQITVQNFFTKDSRVDANYRIEEFQFADGTVWTHDQVIGAILNKIYGTDNDDSYIGGSIFSDIIYARAGNDSLYGGIGNDYLYGEAGNDYLDGGDGDDYLSGGIGNDQLNGGGGSDTYYFEKGWGQDSIRNGGYLGENPETSVDRIVFGAGINAADIVLTCSEYGDLIIKHKNSTDQITVEQYLTGGDSAKVDLIQFADGTVWNQENILQRLPKTGTTGNDVLIGSSANETFNGGKGNDFLMGGEGSDTYIFDKGWGKDTIYNLDNSAGKKDVIRFGTGILPTDITLTRDEWNNDLIIKRKSSTDQIVVQNYFNYIYKDQNCIVEEIQFANGTVWNIQYVRNLLMKSTNGDDNIIGTLGNDTLSGLAGNDTLDGGAGEDYLVGGAGNDQLYGGADSDTYYFERGWGQDTIFDVDYSVNGSGSRNGGIKDVILFGAGIKASDIKVSYGDTVVDIVLSLKGSTDKITVNYYTTGDHRIEEIRFADGTVWGYEHVKHLASQPTEEADMLPGTAQADEIHGLGGNDTIYGYEGNDKLYGDAGNDKLYGNAGDDLLVGGDGDDEFWGGLGADTLYGGAGSDRLYSSDGYTSGADGEKSGNFMYGEDGNDYIYAEAGDDFLYGGSGDDWVSGGYGNDYIEGGAGNDNLNGSEGADTYFFSRGWGIDIVEDYTYYGGKDTFLFGGGVSESQLWFKRNSGDLEISLIGTTDRITVKNWYAGKNYQIEELKIAGGKTLKNTGIDALISAMASFSPPAAGQTTLTPQQQTALMPVIAASWQ